MIERVLNYLIREGLPRTSDEILRIVLNIRSPNAVSADTVLRSIIGSDPRFHFEGGMWRAAEPSLGPTGRAFDFPVSLFIQRPDVKAHPLCLRGGLYRMDSGASLEFDLTRSLVGLDVSSLIAWRASAVSRGLLVWAPESVRLWNRVLHACRIDKCEGTILPLKGLASRVLARPLPRLHPEELASVLEIPAPDQDRPVKVAQFMCSCLELLLERVPEACRFDFEHLATWAGEVNQQPASGRSGFGKDFLRQLPEGPGVYVMRNRADAIIYVGKAGNLKRRVSSYFMPRALSDPKVTRIHVQLCRLETIPTPSELDALLLETQMIRDFRPPINLQVEVHERAAGYGKHRNLILLAAKPEEGTAEAYFLRSGVFVGQQPVRLGKTSSKSLRAKIRMIFFPARAGCRGNREPWESEIVSRWLSRNLNRINFVDLDDAGDYESVVRRIDQYLCDPERLSKKVIYR